MGRYSGMCDWTIYNYNIKDFLILFFPLSSDLKDSEKKSVILCVSATKLYKFSFCRFHCHACNIGKSRCGNILAPLLSKRLSTFDLKGCCIKSLAIQMYHFMRWIKMKKFWDADDNLLMINLAKNTSWRYCCALTKKQVPDLSIE